MNLGSRRWGAALLAQLDRVTVGLLVLALGVRVASVLATRDAQPFHDSLDYHLLAQSVADGHGYTNGLLSADGQDTAFRPPGYPFLLAAVYVIAPGSLTAARLAGAVLGVVVVALTSWIAAKLWGRRVGLIALAIAAVYPPLIVASAGGLVSEALFIPAELGLLACVMHYGDNKGARWLVAGGACLGLAMLTREAGLFLVPGAAAILFTASSADWRRRIRPVLLLIGIAAITIAPWSIRNLVRLDTFVLVSTSPGAAVAGTYNDTAANDAYPCSPDVPNLCRHASWGVPTLDPEMQALAAESADEAGADRALRRAAVEYAIGHPSYVARVAFWNSVRFFDAGGPAVSREAWTGLGVPLGLAELSYASFVIAAPFIVAGAVIARRRRSSRAIWWVPLAITASTVLVYGLARYRAPVEPFCVLFMALAVDAAIAQVRRRTAADEVGEPSPALRGG